ncbi:MAG: glutamyl-tRNA reductase [Bacteroidota bacterium]
MLQQYKILTVTHKSVSLKQMSDYGVHADTNIALEVRLAELKEQFKFAELMYTATCNRVMYFFHSDQEIDAPFITEFFQHINPNLEASTLADLIETVSHYEGLEAIEHFLEVASSIDSLVIGERQILGQLKTAYDNCKSWGFIGDNLRLAMDYAIVSAKAVYSKTKIGDKPVSIVSLAIQKLLRANLPKDSRILMIGAGQTNALVAKFLAKHQFENVSVFNRTLAKATSVAELMNSNQAYTLTDLHTYTKGFDCIVVCTGASDPILQPALYKNLLNGDTDRKVIIDLAIPHNTAPEVVSDFNVNYIEIEGLRNLAKENLAFREKEVQKAKIFLQEQLEAFPTHFQQRQLELAMAKIPNEIKQVKQKAMNEVFHKEFSTLDDTTRDLVEKMLAYMEKKCIGIPMKAAREAIF